MKEKLLITDIDPTDGAVCIRTDNPEIQFNYFPSANTVISHLTDYKWINMCYGKPLNSIKIKDECLIIDGEKVIMVILKPKKGYEREKALWRGTEYPSTENNI